MRQNIKILLGYFKPKGSSHPILRSGGRYSRLAASDQLKIRWRFLKKANPVMKFGIGQEKISADLIAEAKNGYHFTILLKHDNKDCVRVTAHYK